MKKLITQIGESLYGADWKSALASDLNINRKTIQRYASGEYEISPNLYTELQVLLAKRLTQICDAQNQLNQKIQERLSMMITVQSNKISVEISLADVLSKNTENAKITYLKDSYFEVVNSSIKIQDKAQVSFTVFFKELNKTGEVIHSTTNLSLNQFLTNADIWKLIEPFNIQIGEDAHKNPVSIRVYKVNETTVYPNAQDFKRALDMAIPETLSNGAKEHQSLMFMMAFRGALLRTFGKEMGFDGLDV